MSPLAVINEESSDFDEQPSSKIGDFSALVSSENIPIPQHNPSSKSSKDSKLSLPVKTPE